MPKKNVGGIATFVAKVQCNSVEDVRKFVEGLRLHSTEIAPGSLIYDGKFVEGATFPPLPKKYEDDSPYTAKDLRPDALFHGLPHWTVGYPSEGE